MTLLIVFTLAAAGPMIVSGGGGFLFVRTWGGPNIDRGGGVFVGPSGDIFATGMTASFGSGAFLLRYSPDGILVWQKVWNGTAPTDGYSVAADSLGYIYVLGRLGGDSFLSKLSSTGALIFQKNMSYSAGSEGLALTSTGSIYVTGEVDGQLVLLKFDSSGALVWQRQSNMTQSGAAAAVDDSGGVYVLSSNPRPVLVRFNSTGSLQWARSWNNSLSASIASDPVGNVYVAGSIGTLESSNVAVSKFASNGTLLWQRSWPMATGFGAAGPAGYSTAADSMGNVYVTGIDNLSLLLLKLDPNGSLLSAAAWGDGDGTYGKSVALDHAGVPAIVGTIYGSLTKKGQMTVDQTLGSLSPQISSPSGIVKNATVVTSDVTIPIDDVQGQTSATNGNLDVLVFHGSSFPVTVASPSQILFIALLAIFFSKTRPRGTVQTPSRPI